MQRQHYMSSFRSYTMHITGSTHLAIEPLTSSSRSNDSGNIHLDVRRACSKQYPHLHNSNCGGGMITLGVAGTQVDPLNVECTLAYLSCQGACPPLVRLDLTKTCLHERKHGILKHLRQVLLVQKFLKTVDFSWNKLGSTGLLLHVLHALLGHESIQQLYLYGNDIADTPAEVKALAELMIHHRSALRELHLGSNQLLGFHCARELARGLSHSRCSLVELDLWCCRLGDDAGAILIRDGVHKNATASGSLQVLRLNLNDLSYKSCKAITEMLQENQTLQVLNLDSNDQFFSAAKRSSGGDDGYDKQEHQAIGLAFAKVLGKKNTGLRHLGLPNTGMTDPIAAAIFQNLEDDNDTLRYLDIGYNNTIDRQGYAQMITSIPKLTALQYLRTHARSQIMNVPQLVISLGLNTSLLRLTYICVGSVQDQNQMDDFFKRNKSLLQARAILQNVATTRHIAAAKTSTQQPKEEASTVPLGLWSLALHKFARQPLTTSTSTSALYTLLQGQAPTWIQQYQQAKHEAAAAAAATLKKDAAAAAALQEQQEEQKAAAALQQQQNEQQQEQSQTSTFKIKTRLLNRRPRISPPR